VRIKIDALSDAQWEQAIDALGAPAFFLAQLLGGEMPPELEAAILKRLGEPSFSKRLEAYRAALTLTYDTVTDRAMALAFGEGHAEKT
jgi:hypothetical protein